MGKSTSRGVAKEIVHEAVTGLRERSILDDQGLPGLEPRVKFSCKGKSKITRQLQQLS